MIDWGEIERALGCSASYSTADAERLLAVWADSHLRSTYGGEVYRRAVKVIVDEEPGANIARMVLRLLHPREALQECTALVGSPDDEVRTSATMLLADLGTLSELPIAAQLLKDDSPAVRSWALRLVENLVLGGHCSIDDLEPIFLVIEQRAAPEATQARATLEDALKEAMNAVLGRAVQQHTED